MSSFMQLEGLEHTLASDGSSAPVNVIASDRESLFREHDQRIVHDHLRAYSLLSTATADCDV